jgi:fructoselysine-6-P-deglycase FrlB-like protein
MEMLRIGGTYCDACEFRHGPAEALERTDMDAIFLVGTDESREIAERSLSFVQSHGARVIVYDGKDYAGIHPLLIPLVMNSAVQPFIVYSAALRGIPDLHERVYMGRGVLSKPGILWP